MGSVEGGRAQTVPTTEIMPQPKKSFSMRGKNMRDGSQVHPWSKKPTAGCVLNRAPLLLLNARLLTVNERGNRTLTPAPGFLSQKKWLNFDSGKSKNR